MKNGIKRDSLATNLAELMELQTREEKNILEDYAEKIADLNKLALGWSEDYTDVVNLEDELANIKADFVTNTKHQILLGGTPIDFKPSGKTYRPYLGGVEVKGMLKRKLVMYITHGIQPQVVDISGTPAVKYLIQYSTYALEIYVFKNGNSFFKAYASSRAMRRKNTINRPHTYSYEEADIVDGAMFPDMELDMLERALDLYEELENLAFKSRAVAKALAARGDDKEYRIQQLEAELALLR
jgi:hypothetical protein